IDEQNRTATPPFHSSTELRFGSSLVLGRSGTSTTANSTISSPTSVGTNFQQSSSGHGSSGGNSSSSCMRSSGGADDPQLASQVALRRRAQQQAETRQVGSISFDSAVTTMANVPSSTAAVVVELQDLLAAVQEQADKAWKYAALIEAATEVSLMRDAQLEAQAVWKSQVGAGLSGLMADQQQARNIVLNRSTLLAASLDKQLTSLGSQQTAFDEAAAQLSELITFTEAQAEHTAYDTMIIEE
ncbi:hypothetical protein VaNZ11_002192, partial [Volvox africanus]